jgi:hypothetical protein
VSCEWEDDQSSQLRARFRRTSEKRATKNYQHRIYSCYTRRLAFVCHQTRKCVLYLLCVISARVRINSLVKSGESTIYSCRLNPKHVTIYCQNIWKNCRTLNGITFIPILKEPLKVSFFPCSNFSIWGTGWYFYVTNELLVWNNVLPLSLTVACNMNSSDFLVQSNKVKRLFSSNEQKARQLSRPARMTRAQWKYWCEVQIIPIALKLSDPSIQWMMELSRSASSTHRLIFLLFVANKNVTQIFSKLNLTLRFFC